MTEGSMVGGGGRSPAVTAAGVVLLMLTAPYALLAALLAGQASTTGLTVRLGELVVPEWLGLDGMWLFLVVCLLCAWAGLAMLRRWRGWRPLAAAAAGATVPFAVACMAAWHLERMAGYRPTVAVVLLALAGFVLWAIWRGDQRAAATLR